MSMSASWVLGVSGIFLESPDPRRLADWYARTFGVRFHYWPERRSYGAEFVYTDPDTPSERRSTVFVIEPRTEPRGGGAFRVQLGVASVGEVAVRLGEHGTAVETETFPYGTFGRFRDPDGNSIELYEPR